MKIVTVTLNPCMDETLTIAGGLKPGGTNRVIRTRREISGKGLNVSFLLAKWKEDTFCTGFDFQENFFGAVSQKCDTCHIPYDLISVQDELRTNYKIFDETTRTMTELNAQGKYPGKDKEERFMEMMACRIREMDKEDILICTGSAPTGISDRIYFQLIQLASQKGIRTVLDASGPLLKNGVEAAPYIIKPNMDEMAYLMGKNEISRDEIIRYGRELLQKGITYICVTLGADGAFFISRNSILYAAPLTLEIKGIQGAGDSVVAGMCVALGRGLSEKEIFRFGMAAAGGSLLQEGTEMCHLKDFMRLLPYVNITEENMDNL